jgi:hypothetical protein
MKLIFIVVSILACSFFFPFNVVQAGEYHQLTLRRLLASGLAALALLAASAPCALAGAIGPSVVTTCVLASYDKLPDEFKGLDSGVQAMTVAVPAGQGGTKDIAGALLRQQGSNPAVIAVFPVAPATASGVARTLSVQCEFPYVSEVGINSEGARSEMHAAAHYGLTSSLGAAASKDGTVHVAGGIEYSNLVRVERLDVGSLGKLDHPVVQTMARLVSLDIRPEIMGVAYLGKLKSRQSVLGADKDDGRVVVALFRLEKD